MKFEFISSVHNPKIKNIVRLQEKSSERNAQKTIIVEGARELGHAISAGFSINQLFFCSELDAQAENFKANTYFDVSKEVYSKIAYRENSDGYIALLEPKYTELSDLKFKHNPFIIVLESVEKPGNLGAVLRTADAAKVDALIICDPRTDIYNPNVIRSSVGCVFTVPIVVSSNEVLLDYFKENNIKSYAAALTANTFYTDIDFKESCAIIMGTEATGLSDFWLNKCDEQIKIPMLGKIDSLNVSTSTAILTFEAQRQRSV